MAFRVLGLCFNSNADNTSLIEGGWGGNQHVTIARLYFGCVQIVMEQI